MKSVEGLCRLIGNTVFLDGEWVNPQEVIEEAIERAVAVEREACAVLAASHDDGDNLQRGNDGLFIAMEIRARGNS